MITIPYETTTSQGNDNYAVLCEALFLEYEDCRMISGLSDETFSKRVELIRECSIASDLYDLVEFFGEDGFMEITQPVIQDLVKVTCMYQVDYITEFVKHFKTIL